MLFFFLPALLFLAVHGAFTNYTIDDTNGDARTGAIPIYEPGNSTIPYGEGWTENCEGCWVVPNPEEVFDGTWHHATDLHAGYTGLTIGFAFAGTALYVYCIIPTYWGGANWFGTSAGSSTWTNMTFTLDGEPSGSYVYTPPMENTDSSSMQYNTLVFAAEGLPNGEHQFIVEPVNGSIIMFDYAIYTFEDEISSPSGTGSTAPSTRSASPDSFTSLKAFSTFTAVEATTIPGSGGLPTVVDITSVITIEVLPTSTSTPGSGAGISPVDITSFYSKSVPTIISSASSYGYRRPWQVPVAAPLVVLAALFLVFFWCRHRRHSLPRTSEQAPAGPQEGSNQIVGSTAQIRDDVQPVMRENPNVTISSHISLLAQHPRSVDSAANFELQSNDAHLSEIDLTEPRQDISLRTLQSRNASFVSFNINPIGVGSRDDMRSFPEDRISHEGVDNGNQNQD